MHLFPNTNSFIKGFLYFPFLFSEITNECDCLRSVVVLVFALEECGYQSANQT